MCRKTPCFSCGECQFETDNKAMYYTKEKYLQTYTMEEIIDKLYDVLQDVEHAEVNGLDCEELGYYEGVLKSL